MFDLFELFPLPGDFRPADGEFPVLPLPPLLWGDPLLLLGDFGVPGLLRVLFEDLLGDLARFAGGGDFRLGSFPFKTRLRLNALPLEKIYKIIASPDLFRLCPQYVMLPPVIELV